MRLDDSVNSMHAAIYAPRSSVEIEKVRLLMSASLISIYRVEILFNGLLGLCRNIKIWCLFVTVNCRDARNKNGVIGATDSSPFGSATGLCISWH